MKTHRVTVIQSNYLPWKGYFDLIAEAETLVIYDDVQFTKNDWRNRNQIKTAHGPLWLTVPVGQNINRKINEVEIADASWQAKHWKSIKLNYQKQPGFHVYKDFFEDFYLARKWQNLSAMNEYLISCILSFLGVGLKIERSEKFQLSGQKGDRLLELLTKVEATDYYTGPAGMNYILPESFSERNIALHVKHYGPYPQYPQPHGPFVDAVAIVDLLFCCGLGAKDHFRSLTV